jgi:hypothetical protein
MPGSQPLASNEGPAADLPGSRTPESLNNQPREPPKTSGVPTEIPQVRLPDRPHRHPTDTATLRGTSRHSC